MALELRKDSKWWYGRFEINGHRYCVNLDVEVAGERPASARQPGDRRFENSRGAALLSLKRHIAEAHSRKTAVRHLEQLYEIKSGDTIGSIPLAEMSERWRKTAASSERSPRYVTIVQNLLARFVAFIADRHPKVTAMSQITPAIAREFMAAASKSAKSGKEVSGRTFNAIAITMRSVFKRLGPDAGLPANPFQSVDSRPQNTAHREPFTVEQLAAVLKVADPLVRPLIITGISTAMRRGDCCMLRWEDVDLEARFIRVKTNKTGETAEIPIFALLRAELEATPRRDEYVFPEAAALYRRNPDEITRLTRAAFEAAGIAPTRTRTTGVRRASIHDFHSLRTTWITLALTAGIPMELVRRVTGHQTVDVVLKHYFRPGREDFQKTLNAKMPALLTGGEQPKSETPAARAIEVLRAATDNTWRKVIEKAIEILQTSAA
jgi:integrase